MHARTHNYKYALLVVFAACILIGGELFIALPQCRVVRQSCFDNSSAILAPYRYRVLGMVLIPNPSASISAAQSIGSTVLVHSAAVLLACSGLYTWLRRRSGAERAAMGVLILTAVWMLAYQIYSRDISIAVELACITWALVLIEWRLFALVALTAIASMNRETGVLIPLIYAAYYFDRRETPRYWVNVGLLVATWGAVVGAIHLVLGSAEHTLGLAGTLAYNLENISDGIIINILLLPLPALVITQRAEGVACRLLWVAGLSVLLSVIGGAWNEMPRLILVVMPLILPAIIE